MNYLAPQDWSFPVPIAYGPGRLAEVSKFCQVTGMANPLIVTDRGCAQLPFLDNLEKNLTKNGFRTATFSDISPNPRDTEVGIGRAQFHKGGHDGVIAIGGGSGMDGGKAICLTANNNLDLCAFEYEQTPAELPVDHAFPPLICIPTTAGTGAETESTAMITDTARWMKWCIWHPDLKPSFALLDPELTLGLPQNLTAWTGVDALVHAIEAYCVPGFHPLCDGLALEAIRMISTALPQAVSNPENVEARGVMLTGSCLAGISFLKGLGLVHALSHMIGAEFDTQHGLTNAVLLPSVLKFNQVEIAAKVEPMAQATGLPDTDFPAFYNAICKLLDNLAIPRKLTDIGVPTDCAQRIAEKAVQDSAATTNPRAVSVEDAKAVLTSALEIGR